MIKHLLSVFFIAWQTACCGTYYSQCGQDKFIYETFFKDYRHGTFIDIGAHDGVSFSNTYFFERELNWSGICIEPIPKVFAALKANRSATCIEGCVSNEDGENQFLMISGPCEMLSGLVNKYDPRHMDRIHRDIATMGGSYECITVKCYLFNELLEAHGITHVHFLSLDTEGGEFDILSSIDFSRIQIDVISVEDNYGDPRFVPFLTQKGFHHVESLEQDLVFVNLNFKANDSQGYERRS